MKKQFISFFAVISLALGPVGCSDNTAEIAQKTIVDIETYPDSVAADTINKGIFEVLILDYPGLEKVKEQYEAKQYYRAAYALLEYYRMRTNVVNPSVDLLTPTLSTFEKNVAEQALKHRFYIRNFKEKVVNGQDVYYSFDNNGKIDWETLVQSMPDQEFKNQLHRHQWFPSLAKAYRVTGNEAYFEAWKNVYNNWMKAYPNPHTNVAGNNVAWMGLQPAERVRDRLSILPYYLHSTKLTPGWFSVVMKALADEVETIRKGYYKDESNIRLTQSKVVATAGVLMPEFKNAGEWLKEGLQDVSHGLEKQFLADGVQNELDPSYHIGAISDYYDLYQLLQANNRLDQLPTDYIQCLKRATTFVADIIFPDYSLDNFNDTRSSSYTKSVVLKNLKRYAGMFPDDQEMRWLATERQQGKAPLRQIATYKASGYYMMRNGWTKESTMMVIKNNVNPDAKWHCQPDNGTFALYHNGRNFFPDAGCYSYGGTSASNASRNVYRATKMHNTLTVLGKTIDNKHMNGELLKVEKQAGAQLIVMQNELYHGLTHRRAVFFVDNRFFVIVDEAFGDGNHDKVNLNFHLLTGTGSQATVVDDLTSQYAFGAHTCFADNNNMLIRSFAETHQDFGATEVNSPFSSKLGEVTGNRKGYQLSIRKPAQGAARFVSVICPFAKSDEAASMDVKARFTDNSAGTAGTFHAKGASVEVTVNGKTYPLSFTLL